MPAKRTVVLALAALLALSAGAAAGAHGDHAHENADYAHAADDAPDDAGDDRDDSADENASEAPDPPEAASFGLCTAFGHLPSQAQDAGPFSALTAALCEDVDHPSDDRADALHEPGKPAEAGPPR